MEFYGTSQSLIPGLNKLYPVYFMAGNEKIVLQPVEILKGEFRITQVVFKPATELKDGAIYEFVIDNLPKHEEAPKQYNSLERKFEPYSFIVKDMNDCDQPVISLTPAETKKTLVHYGCGPAEWVYFKLTEQQHVEILVRVFVKNTTTGKTTEYLIPMKDGMVMIGHGMCSGAFAFNPEQKYEVSFALVDLSGKPKEKTAAIPFTAPTMESSEE